MNNYMKINDVANWIENQGGDYCKEKATELREIYSKLDRHLEYSNIVEKWMIETFDDGSWGFGAMQYDFLTSK